MLENAGRISKEERKKERPAISATINNPAKIVDNDDSDGMLSSGTTEINSVTYYTLYNE